MHLALLIELQTRSERVFGVQDAAFAHAAILDIFAKADPILSRKLHDAQGTKNFSCAVLPGLGPVVRIRLVLHSKEAPYLSQVFLSGINLYSRFRLGDTVGSIRNIETRPSTWSGAASWADLVEENFVDKVKMDFLTPTAIMKTDGLGRRYTSLVPDPIDIFMGLHRRWTFLGGPSLLDNLAERIRDGGCSISRYQLQTIAFQAPKRLQIGFCGSVSYQLRDTEPEFANSICALARLAHYTGVGYQTARGMGLVQAHIG